MRPCLLAIALLLPLSASANNYDWVKIGLAIDVAAWEVERELMFHPKENTGMQRWMEEAEDFEYMRANARPRGRHEMSHDMKNHLYTARTQGLQSGMVERMLKMAATDSPNRLGLERLQQRIKKGKVRTEGNAAAELASGLEALPARSPKKAPKKARVTQSRPRGGKY